MKSAISGAAVLTAAALLAACGAMEASSPQAAATREAPGTKAVATLEPTKGSTVAGTVTFQQMGDRVHVTATIRGFAPNSEHGFHAHEKGDCSSGDGMSTGGHFNPNGRAHGKQDAEHHAGDMPSLVADANGVVQTSFDLTGVSLGSGAADLVGRGLIVHASPDDYKTQPTGNSGARVACGVIKVG